jgi:hypothetical protein
MSEWTHIVGSIRLRAMTDPQFITIVIVLAFIAILAARGAR